MPPLQAALPLPPAPPVAVAVRLGEEHPLAWPVLEVEPMRQEEPAVGPFRRRRVHRRHHPQTEDRSNQFLRVAGLRTVRCL